MKVEIFTFRDYSITEEESALSKAKALIRNMMNRVKQENLYARWLDSRCNYHCVERTNGEWCHIYGTLGKYTTDKINISEL